MTTNEERERMKKEFLDRLDYTIGYESNYKEVYNAYKVLFDSNECSDEVIEQLYQDQLDIVEEKNFKYRD